MKKLNVKIEELEKEMEEMDLELKKEQQKYSIWLNNSNVEDNRFKRKIAKLIKDAYGLEEKINGMKEARQIQIGEIK